jgi:hypothetical protein
MHHPARFLVVVPTHRPEQSQPTIDALRNSCTYPTEFHQLDGTPSKVHAINKALQDLLSVDRHDIYVTIDDDILLPQNWQHSIACAFDRVSRLGACGIDYAGTEEGEALMAAAAKVQRKQVKDILFRDTTRIQNVAGGNLAMTSHIAKAVGPYPLAADGRQYHVDEDGWRCHRVERLGYRYGYVTNPNGVVQMLQHQNTGEYVLKRQADLDNWVQNPTWAGRI